MLIAFVLVAVLGGVLTAGIVMPAVGAAGAVTSASTNLFEELPTELEVPQASEQSVILAGDGSHLATFYFENRIVVPLEEIAQPMRDAVVAVEDRRFYEHNGVDTEGTARALVENVFGDELQGASTLTQQYVKNVLIEQGRIAGDEDAIAAATETTISRKLREAKLAISLEQQVSKDAILTGYLNIAQFGPSHYGVESAANYYFNKSAADLTIAESAMLARITQSPAKWDPVRNPENAKDGRDTVLGTMLRNGFITQEQFDEASAVPIEEMLDPQRTPRGCAVAGNAAYFCDYVVDEILGSEVFGETEDERRQLLNRGGLIIRTTLDRERQADAMAALTAEVPVNDPSGIKSALSSVEPGTGHILAMAQTTPYGRASEEQPGATEMNLNAGTDHGGGDGFQTGSTF
ncbi:transglycosylase domain-containing protein, partial [Georgenia sp. 10Sc9-8]|nr:transglycosylase domain-containing protein [Georgenia halotolerans]